MRTLSRELIFSAIALLGLACSSEPGAGGPAGTTGGTLAQTAGMPSGGQAPTSGGGATAAGSSSGGAPAGGTTTTTPSAGSAGTATAGSANGGGGSAGSVGNAGSSSGASGSAGASGSGSAGASGSGGGSASGCAGVTSKFCDDFELQTTGMAPKGDFSVDAKGGAMLVDETKAYSGTKALHITTAKPGSQSFLNFTKQFPMNDFHGRAMFFLTRIPTAGIHWDLIDALSTNHWEIGGMYGKFILVVDPPDHGLTSNTFPTGKWFCLQWEFKYGGAGVDNSFLAKMDGTALDKGMFTGADSDGKK
ncbi:MAG TPA: hypothetical protein VNG33_04550, partial [Polyangiaceae bacterium]|nr:hypothetical protein [Polyangiaceae bacterium]